MKKTGLLLLFALTLLFTFGAIIAQSESNGLVSSKLTAEEMAKVKAGEIVVKNLIDEETQQGKGAAFGIFHGKVADFWSVIFDYDNYLDIYPRLEKVVLVEQTGNKYVVEFFMDASIKTIVYTTIALLSADKMRLTWTLDENRPHKYLKKTDGYWQLEQLEPGLILAEYLVDIELDVGVFTALVNPVVRAMSRDDLPDVLISTRKRMESGGAWTRHQE